MPNGNLEAAPPKRQRIGVEMPCTDKISLEESFKLDEGPYRVGTNGPRRLGKLHVFDASDRAVGCGWRPTRRRKLQFVDGGAAWTKFRSAGRLPCSACFKHICIPTSWEVLPLAPPRVGTPVDPVSSDSNGSISSGGSSASDCSNNTILIPMGDAD